MAEARVLYVDDEENDVLFMRLAFRKAGLEERLITLPDGREAIRYLEGRPPFDDRERHPLPAVVLLDLNLPLVSGFDVLRWIRRQASFCALPVVIFSSSGRQEDREAAEQMGADAYWLKPSSGLWFRQIVAPLKERWLATTG